MRASMPILSLCCCIYADSIAVPGDGRLPPIALSGQKLRLQQERCTNACIYADSVAVLLLA